MLLKRHLDTKHIFSILPQLFQSILTNDVMTLHTDSISQGRVVDLRAQITKFPGTKRLSGLASILLVF